YLLQHRIDHRLVWIAAQRQPKLLLLDADGPPRLEAGQPVDIPDVMTLRYQRLLQALDALARQALDRLPFAGELYRRVGGDHVGDMTDEKRVDVGIVIELQHREIVGGEERRTLQSRRQHEEGRILKLVLRERAIFHPHDAKLDPFGDGAGFVRPLLGAVEALGQRDLIAPGLPAVPALAMQRIAGRAERVRHRVPDVAPAVAVEIDGIFLEIRRQELGVAHGPRPGAAHLRACRISFLYDLERGNHLLAEHVRAPP